MFYPLDYVENITSSFPLIGTVGGSSEKLEKFPDFLKLSDPLLIFRVDIFLCISSNLKTLCKS
mgnify:CR=1 FL=1